MKLQLGQWVLYPFCIRRGSIGILSAHPPPRRAFQNSSSTFPFRIFTGKNTSSMRLPGLVTGITRFVIFKVLLVGRLVSAMANLTDMTPAGFLLRIRNGLARFLMMQAASINSFIIYCPFGFLPMTVPRLFPSRGVKCLPHLKPLFQFDVFSFALPVLLIPIQMRPAFQFSWFVHQWHSSGHSFFIDRRALPSPAVPH